MDVRALHCGAREITIRVRSDPEDVQPEMSGRWFEARRRFERRERSTVAG